ncbi:glucans biosynthesis glucosyltransferase MdoH [Gallaecimonas kandeliae]|uniref:glucans biosynthesis glucosyltransferase MdoH n=1 Tax=Gallaecimonas kandeliae TaxID=3029055 RepID=UPI002648B9BA|nr:glucans biosynthesis glucosyltransferase MdoH [Gallaecimonas kandeliae]WKE64840.1 glucans biosynthesis glucosyltransferase MdoH [Gallaecimonas kandeliae]
MNPGTPQELPGLMPQQSLKACQRRTPVDAAAVPSRWPRQLAVVGSALLLSVYAIVEMWMVFAAGGVTWPEYVVLVLFSLTFCWIALACTTGIAGFLVLLRRKRPEWVQAPLRGRTVVLMPSYNEDPARIFAALEAMARGVMEAGEGAAFDWFIIADTTNPAVMLQEEEALMAIRERLPDARIYYRRRRENLARKAGNVADFCRRWGRHYDHMLVLDADSLMEPSTIIQLARRMEANPDAGLIQTIPRLIRGTTLVARVQQFATRIYGPIVGTGLAWWVDRDGNFWGHNAIIRTSAFMSAAGLPDLPGKAPFGGHIMSHDFVEAALLRRTGWVVDIAWDLTGSYEESPPSLIDMAIRDRRWCQGNLQHSKVLGAKGLSWVSRLHMVTGIMSYLSSPLWLMLVLAGFALALQAQFIRPEYFPDSFSLFPAWPVLDAKRALMLFGVTMAVLFAPKLLGLTLALKDSELRRGAGGTARLLKSFFFEVVLSALMAPVMMLIHSGAVASVLLGADSGWNPQRRDDGSLPWKDVWRRHRSHVATGLVLAVAAWFNSWQLLAWLSPAILGMLLAVPLSYYTAAGELGARFRDKGWLQIPEETKKPAIERALDAVLPFYEERVAAAPDLALLARDPVLGRRRLPLIDNVAERRPGEIRGQDATVITKLGDTSDPCLALSYMNPKEQAWLLSTPELYQRFLAMSAAKVRAEAG